MSSTSCYLRIILISLIIALLGLTPRPHEADENLVNASQDIARGELLLASRQLASAGEFYPWRYDLNIEAGRTALQAGDAESAIQYLERPGTRSHLSIDDLVLLGDAYNQKGDAQMAEAIWKHISTLGAYRQVHERLVSLYYLQEDYYSASNQLKDLLALNPSDISLYYQIGTLYAATSPLDALPYLVQAAEIDPEHAQQARSLHDKIRSANLFDEPAYTFLIAGRQLASTGDWKLAAEAFHHATDLRPDYADAWALSGEARQQLAIKETGSISDAGYPALVRALQVDPDSILANTFMGLFWERQGEYAQAQVFLQQAVSLSPEDPFLHTELGSILAKVGDLPAAQAAYENAIQLTPDRALFYRLLAEFALEQQIQIRELALPAARQAVTLEPHDPGSLDVMSQVMLQLQDYRSAERFARSALQANPGYSPAYLHLGTSYLYLGEPDLARQWLRQAAAVQPGSWVAAQAERMLEYYFP